MKVLTRGNAPKRSPWWVGIRFDCPRCGGAFELEERDRGQLLIPDRTPHVRGRYGRQRTLYMHCPTAECDGGIHVGEPEGREAWPD